ncbi:MAG: hypothetical protein CMM25_01465 [Rhodospirillaceae bacterium]|nr:hypothetical protein [Rhodospirillaceae bacterium]
MFSAPIPGQSLTSEPKNVPWENPPQFPDPESALMWHMDRLQEPEKIKAIAGLLTLGLDVVTLTEGLLRAAVIDGRHSIDVSLLIGPIIHEYIVGTADAAGLNYSEGMDEPSADEVDVNYTIRSKEAAEILKELEETGEVDFDTEPEETSEESMEMSEEFETPIEEKPMGLMSRGEV